MAKVPRGERLVLTLIGKRNAGKSSLINALTGQDISIVSTTPGTTTDPVAKSYELLPLGPVTIYDTAGIDDVGDLGEERVKRTRKILFRTDIALIVTESTHLDTDLEKIITDIQALHIPFILVFNKADITPLPDETVKACRERKISFSSVSSADGTGIRMLKEKLMAIAPLEMSKEQILVSDLIRPGQTVLLVVPIDLAAPKGRLILPQVQVLRELLDSDAIGIIVKERELEKSLTELNRKPDLVITDSQVVLKVVGDIDPDVRLTTFSTLFARYKGNFETLIDGARKIDELEDGDKVLIAESCSHHVQPDDIGRVKIPRWIRQYTGKDLTFDVASGHDFPDDLESYALVIHCGACMTNRMEVMRRIMECERRGVKITNYGVAISKLHGVLERVIAPFFGG
ncbi:MAG: [FeFe] hydrogenase H-cluster maturation GTPase HydF [Candidatus Zophobacter franzmannii]|nr:[FeFe] hydrogenase H-cluster maturation GTPase HydF [Candidatus Zophobacter franzmannii]